MADTLYKKQKNKELLFEMSDKIIVNTDGDNHYDQSRIPELIQPILDGKADITIGSRKVEELEHKSDPAAAKLGQG